MIKISNEAMKRWGRIPSEIQYKLLSNAFCSKCLSQTTVINFTLQIDEKNYLHINGKCKTCLNEVTRVID